MSTYAGCLFRLAAGKHANTSDRFVHFGFFANYELMNGACVCLDVHFDERFFTTSADLEQ